MTKNIVSFVIAFVLSLFWTYIASLIGMDGGWLWLTFAATFLLCLFGILLPQINASGK